MIGMGYFLRQLVTKDSRVLDYVNERETSQPTPCYDRPFFIINNQSIDNESIIIITVLKTSSLSID